MELPSRQTIGSIGKEAVLIPGQELTLFAADGEGVLNHMWFGGNFAAYAETLIRVYVDGEAVPAIEMELFLGHGIGFQDDAGPWGNHRLGKTGSPSGVYNYYLIPFGHGIRVTAELAPAVQAPAIFWWIIRGITPGVVSFGGDTLPPTARLRLQKQKQITVAPLATFPLARSERAGLLYQVMLAARSTNFSYLEAILRAEDRSGRVVELSSGLEDYFLGTYYFNRGPYCLPSAGVTHLNQADYSFSAFRLHENDPVFFRDGFQLTCRCGEEANGKVFGPNPPETTEYTTYTWLYEWPA